MNTLWAVVVGGALTIAGQGVAETIRAHVASTSRVEHRQQLRRRYNLDALAELESSALRLHDVLIEYQSVDVPNASLEKALREATSLFDACVPRVESSTVRTSMRTWAHIAVSWVNDDENAAAENKAWQEALNACGEAMRSSL